MVKRISLILILYFYFSLIPHAQLVKTDSSGYTKYFYGNGQVSSEGYIIDGKPDGYWKTYYVDGKMKSEGNRKNLLLDSTWIFFNNKGDTIEKIDYKMGKKNGYYIKYQYKYLNTGNDSLKTCNLLSKELYINDKKEGLSYYYSEDGNLHSTIYYLNNRKEGPGREFATDGRIITLLEYHNDYEINKERINRNSYDGAKQGVWKEFYPNGRVKIECCYKADKLNGYFREYDKYGNLFKFEYYEDGLIVQNKPEIVEDSLRIRVVNDYFTNGRLKSTGTYKDSLPLGMHREYNEEGKIVTSKLYDDSGNLEGTGIVDEEGKKQDEWTLYYRTGEIMAKGKYKDNKRTGEWIFTYENSKVAQKGTYKNGKPDGTWKWFYPEGQIKREENYINGTTEGLYFEFYKSGDTLARGEYMEGKETGIWYYNIGDQIETGPFNEGLKQGFWKTYNHNGNILFAGNYIQGSEDGKHKFYYENGKLRTEGHYIMGSREGKWLQYDELGNLTKHIVFKKNMEYKINGNRLKLPKDD